MPHLLDRSGGGSGENREIVRRHTTLGPPLIELGNAPDRRLAATIARQHHERWDGSGYPHGLTGTEISREARIVAICDDCDALRNTREQQHRFSHKAAMAAVIDGGAAIGPNAFDPCIKRAFLRYQDQFRAVCDVEPASPARNLRLAA